MWVGYALVPLVVAVGLVTLALWLRARRGAVRVRKRLEGELSAGDDDEALLLEGRLVVDGDGCKDEPVPGVPGGWAGDLRQRAKVAAVTGWLSKHRSTLRHATEDASSRAAALRLETDDGPVSIDGPVTVAAGSHLLWTGNARYADDEEGAKRFVAIAAVVDGDRVTALGVRRRNEAAADQSSAAYRQTAPFALGPASSLASVHLAAAGKPRAALRRASLLRHPAQPLALAIALVPAWWLGSEHLETQEECRSACARSGRCEVVLAVQRAWQDEGWRLFDCEAPSDEACRRSLACRQSGECTAVDGRCSAQRDADCAHTRACRSNGCSAVDGDCKIAEDEDCRATVGCVVDGRCGALEGACRATEDAHCERTLGCIESGECSAIDGVCRATDASCKASNECTRYGRCAAVDGFCQPTDEGCSRTEHCLSMGKCAAVDGSCEPTEHEHCLRSQGCIVSGDCFFSEEFGDCVQENARCEESLACRVAGRCHGPRYDCHPESDADCEKSRWCEERGYCELLGDGSYHDAECASSCATTLACRKSGQCSRADDGSCRALTDDDCRGSVACEVGHRCTAVDGRCRARDEDCEQTEICRVYGRCTADGRYCHASSDEDCEQSRLCELYGECTAREGRCVADSREDCRSSRLCRDGGKCFPREGECVGPYEDAHCAELEACRTLGHCAYDSAIATYSSSPIGCVPGTQKHCEKSELCERYGWCDRVDISDTMFSDHFTCFISDVAAGL